MWCAQKKWRQVIYSQWNPGGWLCSWWPSGMCCVLVPGIRAKVVQAPDFQWGGFPTWAPAESWAKSFPGRTAFLVIHSRKTSTSKPPPSPRSHPACRWNQSVSLMPGSEGAGKPTASWKSRAEFTSAFQEPQVCHVWLFPWNLLPLNNPPQDNAHWGVA